MLYRYVFILWFRGSPGLCEQGLPGWSRALTERAGQSLASVFSAASSVDTVYLCTRSELDSLFFFFFLAHGSAGTVYLCTRSEFGYGVFCFCCFQQLVLWTLRIFVTVPRHCWKSKLRSTQLICFALARPLIPPHPLAVLCNEKYFNQVSE